MRLSSIKKLEIIIAKKDAGTQQVLAKYGQKKDCGWFYLSNEFWGDSDRTTAERERVSDPKRFPFKIVAKLPNGTEIGFANVDHHGNKCFVHEVDVEKKYRRKGVATAMYDWAEVLTGKKCISSEEAYEDDEDHMSKDAKKFWNSRWKKSAR